MSKYKLKSRFLLTGHFVRFVIKDDWKIKGFYLAVAGEEIYLKLSKRLRYYCTKLLVPGVKLQVIGQKRSNRKRDRVKLKAEAVWLEVNPQDRWNGHLRETITVLPPGKSQVEPPAKPKCILICQKSSCRRRGGNAVWQALEQGIADAGLGDRVKLKGTGCINKCQAGPNIIMPDKIRYSRVKIESIPCLLAEYFTW